MAILNTYSSQPQLCLPSEPVDYCPLLPELDNRAYTRLNVPENTWALHAWLYDMADRLRSGGALALRFQHCASETLGGPPLEFPVIWEGGPNCVFDINSFMRSLNLPMGIPTVFYEATVEWLIDYGHGWHQMRHIIRHEFTQPATTIWAYEDFDFEECEDVTYTELLAAWQLPQWTLL
jgi:hypothetical protein